LRNRQPAIELVHQPLQFNGLGAPAHTLTETVPDQLVDAAIASRSRLAANLRRLREGQELSQEVLAEVASLHRTFVSQVEREMNNISIDNIERLAEALGVDILELLAKPK